MAAAVVLVTALSGCAADPAPPVASSAQRDAAAPIASIAGFDADRLEGLWTPRLGRAPYSDGLAVLSAAGDGLAWTDAEGRVTRLTEVAPGRFAPEAGDPADALWVLWIDEGDRTVMLGSPSGRHLVVLDRAAEGGGDRMEAARRIADFYGFDTARLEGPA